MSNSKKEIKTNGDYFIHPNLPNHRTYTDSVDKIPARKGINKDWYIKVLGADSIKERMLHASLILDLCMMSVEHWNHKDVKSTNHPKSFATIFGEIGSSMNMLRDKMIDSANKGVK